MAEVPQPFVSVIIPVFNDSERLQLCLAALAQQTYERSHFEIIVIDNGSKDLDLIQAAVSPYDNALLTFEPTPGSYAARNKGLALAQGDAIAFTDADCIPAPNWITQGVEQLQINSNCGLVIGQIKVFFANPQCLTPVELFESVTAFSQEQLLKQMQGGATANLFTWRHVIDTVGDFDAQLKSSGDLEWGQRVYAQGYLQVYAESVLVHHPARSSIPELYARTRRLVGGRYDWQLKQAKTDWQRQAVFAKTLLQHSMPPVMFTINTFLDRRLNGIDQKLKVSGVMILVRCISVWETLRLKLGGLSSRV